MKSLVRTVPKLLFRTTRRVSKLPLPVLAGAAALIYRKARHSDQPSPVRAATPSPAPTPADRSGTAKQPAEPVAPREPEVVIDPVPLPEPAVDLDADVTLPSELPIRGYDAMNATDASRAIRELTDLDEVRTVLSFEEENAKRSTVLTAARTHLTVLEQGVRR
ncbi:MAG TPA: hypothetical protein VNC22_16805 [Sporichthya sp.]|nr:hypothetical protein [Sporichthya sp.]